MPLNDTHPDRTNVTATDLDLDAAVAGVVVPVCARLGQRHYLKGVHLRTVMLEMVMLDANGANEAELNAYGLALLDLARTLKTAHTVDDRTLARMQLDADLADDHLRGVLAIDGDSPVMLEAWAGALEKTATINVATARVARRKARQRRSGRDISRHQLGLNGAA